jgi:tripartite-type tricarboxylate transporter receptor subunit TctC
MMSIYPHVYEKMGYDPVADFQPVSQVATFDLAMAVGPSVPAKSLDGLVEWLRSNPAKASYGTPAAGSQPHFLAVQFARTTGLDLRHVAYKGTPLAVADLFGGHLPMVFGPTQELVEAHKAGHLRVLATTGTQRSPVLTDVPTFMEAGYSIQGEVWFGVYVPAKTSPNVVARLNTVVVAAVQAPEMRSRMLALGMRPTGTSAVELAKIQQTDFERWGPLVKASGFKPDQ